jgi:hypothetical protein
MDNYGLYEDWSLFNGDLLADFPLLANEEPAPALIEEQDGSLSVTEAPPKPSPKLVLGHPQQGSAELGLADLLASSPTRDVAPAGLESAWMDTKVDLQHLLVSEPLLPSSESLPCIIPPTAAVSAPAPQPRIIQIVLQPAPQSPAVVPSTSAPASPGLQDDDPLGVLNQLLAAAAAEAKMPVVSEAEPAECEMDTDDDLLKCFKESGLEDLLSRELDASITDAGPILSPVSADDVESLLSSSPPASPDSGLASFIDSLQEDPGQSITSFDNSISDSDELSQVYNSLVESFQGVERKDKQDVRSEPYTTKSGGRKNARSGVEKKERKKEQNRTAALRYRQKKKGEQCTVEEECDQLKARNTELKDKVDSISREIKYLKNLMAEVYKAKGLVLKTTK